MGAFLLRTAQTLTHQHVTCFWLDHSYHTGFGTGLSCLFRNYQRQSQGGGWHRAPDGRSLLPAPVPR